MIEEKIQAQFCQIDRQTRVESKGEIMRVGAMAKAEGRAHESYLGEDVKRRTFIVRADAEMQKRVAAMNAILDNVGGDGQKLFRVA